MSTVSTYKGSSRSGGIMHWFMQRWSGVLLVIMLFTHFILCHFTGDHSPMTYEKVMQRLADPAWKAFDLAFLYLAAYHGVMGALSVISDYKICKCWKVTIYSIGLAILAYITIFGTVTIVSLHT
jgi:succinate dehydrogenase / fumarate reductase membrane anchor subunit